MEKYYIVINGQQTGPFSLEELKEKAITQTTLVWTEKMDNWAEAKNVETLKDIIRISPPPIPQLPNHSLTIEKSTNSTTEILIAKEIKFVFKQAFYGLIIGLISFLVFYFFIYKATKYDNFDVNQIHFEERSVRGVPDVSDFPLSYACSWSGPDIIRSCIRQRKEIYTKKAAYNGLITFLIAASFLIGIKYIRKSAKWVQETSEKDNTSAK